MYVIWREKSVRYTFLPSNCRQSGIINWLLSPKQEAATSTMTTATVRPNMALTNNHLSKMAYKMQRNIDISIITGFFWGPKKFIQTLYFVYSLLIFAFEKNYLLFFFHHTCISLNCSFCAVKTTIFYLTNTVFQQWIFYQLFTLLWHRISYERIYVLFCSNEKNHLFMYLAYTQTRERERTKKSHPGSKLH